MTGSGQQGGMNENPRQEKDAADPRSDQPAIRDLYWAERDQHFHYGPGVRRAAAAGDVCPYPGLAAFTAEQAEWFFGRDQLTSDLISRLDRCLVHGGPVMVVGASGSGSAHYSGPDYCIRYPRGG